jgi:hypothetical protein
VAVFLWMDELDFVCGVHDFHLLNRFQESDPLLNCLVFGASGLSWLYKLRGGMREWIGRRKLNLGNLEVSGCRSVLPIRPVGEGKRFALCANAHISESRYGAPGTRFSGEC